jgi:hypothetical protein
MLSEAEIRAIASTVVQRAKATARVDQGTLRRSIAYTYVRGVVTFRQIYYGEYGTNSRLERIAAQLMPNGVEYRIELTDFGGDRVEISRTRSGRRKQTTVLNEIVKNNSPKIKDLISKVLATRKKKDGEEKE